jgi:hypothetical protein
MPCWYVSVVGTSFQLALGAKVPRKTAIRNLAHSQEYRLFEGEANLLVWCSWRLDSPSEPLVSSDCSTAAAETKLDQLVGKNLKHVTMESIAGDLLLTFDSGLRLTVFCDHLPGAPSFDGNWDLFLPDRLFSVGPGDRVQIRARDGRIADEDSGGDIGGRE